MKNRRTGLDIDVVNAQVRVPQEEVSEQFAIRFMQFLNKRKVTLDLVQSLLGSVNFLCKAIAPGRAFLRCLTNLTQKGTRPHHKVRITHGARLDLLMWLKFLVHFNGVSAFLTKQQRRP